MVNMVDKMVGTAGGAAWLLQSGYQNGMKDSMVMSVPEWMIKIGDVFSTGTIAAGDGYTDHTELLEWKARSSRETRGLTANQMLSSSTMKHSIVEVRIPIGDYLPVLETKMHTGEVIDSISLVRLSNIGDSLMMTEIQNITFNQCQIVFFEQSGDVLILAFRFNDKTNAFTGYNQDGTPIGDTVSNSVNFTTGEASDDG